MLLRRAIRIVVLAAAGLLPCAGANAQTPAKPDAPAVAAKALDIAPADLAFGRSIALIRGHLGTGEELVRQRDWSGAEPHFHFPTEEIYGVIRAELHSYKTPPFDFSLKALARTVHARSASQYPKALGKVEAALAAADAGLKTRQPDWPRFELAVAMQVLKTAPDEYEDAVAKDRIVHPIGYQTARGFILQAERMVEGVAGELAARNSAALADMRAGFTQLKQAFASVDVPKRPPIADADMLAIVARIDAAAAKLM